jgi:hypothetical protein
MSFYLITNCDDIYLPEDKKMAQGKSLSHYFDGPVKGLSPDIYKDS